MQDFSKLIQFYELPQKYQDSCKGSETSETSAVATLPDHKNSHEKWRLSYCVDCFCSYNKNGYERTSQKASF